MNKVKKLIFIVLLLNTWITLSWACGHPPPPPEPQQPPPQVWMIDHGIDPVTGLSNMWFGVEIDPVLFPITQPTVCTCGIGLGGANLPLIPSLNVTGAMLAVTNMLTHEIDPLDGFDFTPDSGTTGNAESNALIPDQQWAGLSAVVTNFVQPILAANEVLKIWFNLELHPDDLQALHVATSGQMLGFSIGGDPNNPTHAPQQFTAFKVPEPATAVLFSLGILIFSTRQVKRFKP